MSSAIPDADKKLSYDCLKCVIQQFEVQFRFRIAERLPKISFAERAAPLYLSKLSISEASIKINDTRYSVGIICEPREGPTPGIFREEHRKGGCKIDLDRFGFVKLSLPELTPGDIFIQEADREGFVNYTLEFAEARLVEAKNILTRLEREKRDLDNSPEDLENISVNPVEIEPEHLDRRRRNPVPSRQERLERINGSIRYWTRNMESAELSILRFQCKRDNRPIPFDMCIQYTKTSPDGNVYIERFKYDKTLREAQKYLINKILGNRPVATKIKSLGFWEFRWESLIIGLPEGVKFDVQEFGTSGKLSEVLKRIEIILEYPNRPFARLISERFELKDAQNPRVREAEVLELTDNMRVNIRELHRQITNKKVVITLGLGLFPEEYPIIVENMIDTKGTLGTYYEIVHWCKRMVREAMTAIAKHFENSVVKKKRNRTMSPVIPDADKKLSYDCLKCVIQKLEMNFRFQLSERLPKISLAEKAAPLYISKLSISEGSVKINDTKYRLGFMCKPREGPTPEIIKRDQRRGGCKKDFDKFGFEKRSLPELTPGDIFIQNYDPVRDLNDNLEMSEARVVESKNRLSDLERQKRDLEKTSDEQLEDITENPMGIVPEEDVLVEIDNQVEGEGEDEEDIMEPDQLDGRRNSILSREEELESINEYIEYTIMSLEHDELSVLRFQCIRDNRPLPYDMFIQFTRKSPDGNVYIERFKYDKTLREAQKYLINKLLGNRPVATKIRSLGFWAVPYDGLIIGLPEGIKLDVQEFGTSGKLSEVLQRMETIFEYPNRPFTRLVSDELRLEDAQNPKVREAEVLELTDNMRVEIMELYREITNKKVVMTLGLGLRPVEYAMIVENLIDTKGTLGTYYEITQWCERTARNAIRAIARRFGIALVDER
ncbi:hypothetical protein B9Z55_000151 [Caenorhabditis nigoni]|nr:hypothetical protein B9Z55_000151 [Caenorhabditis nigoni]